jgi:hypothetical protein
VSAPSFTPGPWRVQGGEVVAPTDPICSMPTLYRETREARTQLDADAHLIAAAPELYETLADVLPRNVCLTNKNVPDSTVVPLDCTMGDLRRISAALAKARGDQ